MKKNYTDPFSPNVDSTLPPRGTGLERGTAGERREGTPRTEEERETRHAEKTKEQTKHYAESLSLSIKDQWRIYHENKRRK